MVRSPFGVQVGAFLTLPGGENMKPRLRFFPYVGPEVKRLKKGRGLKIKIAKKRFSISKKLRR